MKKYIQPAAEVLNLQFEGLVAFSANNSLPHVDDPANNFSNALLDVDQEWDDEE